MLFCFVRWTQLTVAEKGIVQLSLALHPFFTQFALPLEWVLLHVSVHSYQSGSVRFCVLSSSHLVCFQFWLLLGRRPPVWFPTMDNILRNLEDLSRTELVWLNTYLAGALPPENEQQPHPLPKAAPHEPATMLGHTDVDGPHGATVAPLPERIDALNYSLDPWERTGAAPQGWATHLRQAMVPIQGYIQLRPQTESSPCLRCR